MDEIQVVKEELTTSQPSEGTNPTVVIEETTKSVPGEKTDSALLLKSLQEEREKRRITEERNRQLEEELKSSTPSEDEVFSDEGKAIVQKYVEPLGKKIDSLTDELALKDLQIQYPAIKDLLGEFNEYRKDYPKHKLDNVAKLFLNEKGLIEPTRKGLEKQTGGVRTPLASGMTAEDVKKLRETNYKKYQDMVRNGQIVIE